MLLSNKTVVLGITGGIAAYKMPNVAHALFADSLSSESPLLTVSVVV